ncbi:MAG: PKD domain-containing protein, partial [Flavobacteriales bacterium]
MKIDVFPKPNVDAGDDRFICLNDSTISLNGSVTGGSTTGTWTSSGTGSFTPSPDSLDATYHISDADSAAGSFYLKLTSRNNGICKAESDSILVTMDSLPVVNAGMNDTLCGNQTVNLNGNITGGNGTGVWTTAGLGEFSDSSDLNASYTLSGSDTAQDSLNFVLSATKACKDTSDTTTVSISSAPNVNIIAEDTVCSNNPAISLDGDAEDTSGIEWSTNGNGTFTPSDSVLNTSYDPDSSEIESGDVVVTLEGMNSICPNDTDTMNIALSEKPIVDAGNDRVICNDAITVRLNGSVTGGSNQGVWSSLGPGNSSFFNPNDSSLTPKFIPGIADTAAGQIELVLSSVNNGSCLPVTDTMKITWIDRPDVTASAVEDSLCIDTSGFELNGSISGNANSGYWTTTGSGTFKPDDTSMNVTYMPDSTDIEKGQVDVFLVPDTSCSPKDSAKVSLYINPKPQADFNYTPTSCTSTNIEFEDQSTIDQGNITDYNWDMGDGKTKDLENFFHLYDTTGNFEVTLTIESDRGCRDTVSKTVGPSSLTADFTVKGNCLEENIIFKDSSIIKNDSVVNYKWSLGDSTIDSG